MLQRKIQVGIIGAGVCTPEEADSAYRVGCEIARRGAVLICGGLGGVMEAACQGTRDGGGTTVGLLPTDQKKDANPYVDVIIVTGIGHARNAIVAGSSDVIIAVGGEYGTLSEIALGLTMGIKVISLQGGWEIPGVVIAQDSEAAVDMAFKFLLQ